MAIARQTFIRNLHQVGLLTVAALGIAVAGILWALLRGVSGFSPSQVIILATAAIVILGTLVMLFLVSWLTRVILRPVSNAAAVAGRVAAGDLTAPEFIAPGGASQVDALTNAVSAMVTELRSLVGAIRGNAQDAAAMAQEISSATEEMSASTEEVSGTCNDLTDRATRQATLVRAAAEDAAKILAIAEELAASALGSAERNAALAELARSHREQLDQSSAELQRLAEEVERGAEEATALAAASEEIGKFVTQTKAIARQTHMLALNAGIEAARAGEEGRGFAVVAEEVRKLAGQAAQAATSTSDTVRAVQTRVEVARDRLLRLAKGGQAAREAADTAARGLSRVASDAEANDTWTRQISKSADEVRGLIGGIVGRMSEVSGGTEDVAAAAEEIAASSQELSASTTEIANSAQQLAHAAQALFGEVSRFKVEAH